ncbi:MAG: glutathione S-transferase family protein [Aquabacterium sp.]|uniref:glutathione S-transferase family protein n=1 Tax=Aquabacterium sp. TaxID=1872578 RepID=UPI0011FDAB96|nr:glutathione S-transferase family protein [Aquabacterium sp.]TAK95067.1 MAG: glutathione S-transferase family protein [Aquabacterium sp.]
MIQLFHCISARSFRPLWLLEELGLPYELHVLPFPPRVHRKDFLTQNPLGTIPLLVDGSARMSESAAMCQYLAARHSPRQLDVAVDEAAYGDYLNFLHFGEATLTFPQTLVLRYSYFEPEGRRQPQVVQDYAKWFLARLKTLDQRLANSDYLCADRFTAADVSVGYALLLAQHLEMAPQFPPNVAAYWARLQARPAYQRAQTEQWRLAKEQGAPEVAAPDIRP